MKTFALAAVIAATLSSAPAFAQHGAPTRVTIDAAGLDLATARGRAALDLRIVRAARTVCGTPSPADLLGRTRAEACVAEVRVATAAQRETLLAAAARQDGPRLASR
ncbi:MAG TPA: UrcA family protein [Allosphingosinicella sp.]|nr:UrcA family protein [Allosphingosinicella sp.]